MEEQDNQSEETNANLTSQPSSRLLLNPNSTAVKQHQNILTSENFNSRTYSLTTASHHPFNYLYSQNLTLW